MTVLTALPSYARKVLIGSLAALAFGGGVAATATPASAGGWGYHHGGGWGYGGAAAAGVVGGLALGALAASAARPTYYGPVYVAGDCYVVHRRVLTDYGWRRVRRTVCD
ncbi:hypothetical protein GCM10007036_06730 [Alsobacter metallidurans]|uniref:Uncharacterized protein n=1 Tax=Alsobacter metallidurans TaxID=340221 RepID=A0A917I4J0_9HYPH|nr:hypothetical protein [Alsobacter metallidurans]GGH10293.1 hypothetical protein GCM10007036_06730 [Alsobacter metallidurans]